LRFLAAGRGLERESGIPSSVSRRPSIGSLIGSFATSFLPGTHDTVPRLLLPDRIPDVHLAIPIPFPFPLEVPPYGTLFLHLSQVPRPVRGSLLHLLADCVLDLSARVRRNLQPNWAPRAGHD
jgi:hypothetical protein